LHATAQAPAVHATLPFVGTAHGEQELPHVATDVSSAQEVPQAWKPVLHAMPQVLATHVALPEAGEGQAWPQLSQSSGSVDKSTHDPLQSVSEPQSVVHFPLSQTSALEQAFGHDPQWS